MDFKIVNKVKELIKSNKLKEAIDILEEVKNERLVIDIAKIDTLNSLDYWKYYSDTLNVDFIDSRLTN